MVAPSPMALTDAADAVPERARTGLRISGLGGAVEMAQMTIEQRIIIRMPMLRRKDAPKGKDAFKGGRGEHFGGPLPPPHSDDVEWRERKGPKCVPVKMFAGATQVSERNVDFLMRDRTRMRARLGRDCQAADLYAGFYVKRQPDGELCADRDSLLARSGASCEIESFKRLVPEEP